MHTWILFFTVLLKNSNISSKIKRSKVTDYAALNICAYFKLKTSLFSILPEESSVFFVNL